MRLLRRTLFRFVLPALLLTSCVDQLLHTFPGSIDVVVVDGFITNLVESHLIRISRSKSDPLTGRPGFAPITGATVEVLVDSDGLVVASEIEEGVYRLPADFRGQVGHTYQLRFTLPDGTRYESSPQSMMAAPPIRRVTARFNPTTIPPALVGGFTAGHDLYLDTDDPADETNYYRWDWRLWESQRWCRTCVQGAYSIHEVKVIYDEYGNATFETGDDLLEDCFYAPPPRNNQPLPFWVYDYECRTRCWAILSSTELNLFSDSYTNGGPIANRRVAQIPFYQHRGCLVEIRQAALTPSAYRFYKDLEEQTQNSGGVADPPPSVTVGNIRNMADPEEVVVGFFTAAGVSTYRYWLDRKDTRGVPPGLFLAFNGREPEPEPGPPAYTYLPILDKHTTSSRPYTALCVESDEQTALKPEGWPD
jgi:hypothetical protein